jgi:periplasmic divalent cation tolerance protein
MIPLPQCVSIFVTAPDVEVARKIAHAALESKVVACANIVPQIESHYWWEGKIETSGEALIIFKTTERQVAPLQELVRQNHPYQVPEFVVNIISGGSPAYLDWIRQSVAR